MARFIKFLLVILWCSFASCQDHSAKQKQIKNTTGSNIKCDLQRAEEEILKLPEVISRNALIDSLSNHTHRISFLSDSSTIDGTEYYEIKAGYNSDLRYETYYNFYVEKGNCKNIKIAEPVEGDIIPLSEWRIRNRKEQPLALESWPYKSFVLSCGSGCAMTYSAAEITKDSQHIKVKFNVDQYIDEVLTETFKDDFIFSYDASNRLQKIMRKGENEDFLESQSRNSEESFRKFGDDVMKFVLKNSI